MSFLMMTFPSQYTQQYALKLQHCSVLYKSTHKTTQSVIQGTSSSSTRKQSTIHDNVPILNIVQLSQVPYDTVTIQMTVQQCKTKPN